MLLRRRRAQYHQLPIGERNLIIELGLSLCNLCSAERVYRPTLCRMLDSGRSKCTPKRKWCAKASVLAS
ncbi:hypothetical protein TNCV_5051131 [Trichonephila clavipes]|nr:hypothetical protein TNCV_5051131 [Trichonephila clavipes]